MNDFTKEELEIIAYCFENISHRKFMANIHIQPVYLKVNAMIDYYSKIIISTMERGTVLSVDKTGYGIMHDPDGDRKRRATATTKEECINFNYQFGIN